MQLRIWNLSDEVLANVLQILCPTSSYNVGIVHSNNTGHLSKGQLALIQYFG